MNGVSQIGRCSGRRYVSIIDTVPTEQIICRGERGASLLHAPPITSFWIRNEDRNRKTKTFTFAGDNTASLKLIELYIEALETTQDFDEL